MNETQNGLTPQTAFVIEDSSGAMSPSIFRILNNMFGGIDGSYFVHNESTLTKRGNSVKYKILYIEDGNGDRHTLYFNLCGR